MIINFPTIIEEELLYSVFARYHIRSMNTNIKATVKDLFSSKSVSASVELHSHMDELILNLSHFGNYSSEELINNHTLFKYYTAFYSEERTQRIMNALKSSDGRGIYGGSGLMASSISSSSYFRLCPDCVEDDLKIGEVTWKRIHQLSSVKICPYHNKILSETTVLTKGLNKHEYIAPKEEFLNDAKQLAVADYKRSFEVRIANLSIEFLTTSFTKKNISWFKAQYKTVLSQKGYANINGRYHMKSLLDDFTNFYTIGFLESLDCSIDMNAKSNWLSDLVRVNNHRETNTLKHILLIIFLDIDVDELFNKSFKFEPFGNGPWKCMNRISNHYGENKIKDIELTYSYDTKKTCGILKCKCGYSYMIMEGENDYCRTIEYGYEWECQLREIVKDNLSLRESARLMYVDPKTLLNYCKEHKVDNHFESNMKLYKKAECRKYIERGNDRNLWKEQIELNPERTITELRKMNQGLYMRLYRFDLEWLKDNKPNIKIKHMNKGYIDWKSRDEYLVNCCKHQVNQILSLKKPVRLTISSITTGIGKKALILDNLIKLNLTSEYLESVKESDEDFRKRRIRWAINELVKELEELKIWKIFRKAGIKDKYQKGLIVFVEESIITWLG